MANPVIYFNEQSLFTYDNNTIDDFISDNDKENTINELLSGLTAENKFIASKFFYDAKGSNLFEEITRLPEYYLTETEKSILKTVAPDIIKGIKDVDIIELGSGDCSKISLILNAFNRRYLNHVRYIAIDVSHSAIIKSAKSLSQRFAGLKIQALVADFTGHVKLIPSESKLLICFFGSTIGNLDQEPLSKLMTEIRSIMHNGDQLLIGFDMLKNKDILENAYNDSKQVTAAFNKNILNVVNRILKSDFNADRFEHKAFFNPEKSRIEMHLSALEKMEVSCPFLGKKIIINQGETIHTENSYKFTLDDLKKIGLIYGLSIRNIYSDDKQWFSLVHFIK